MCTGCIQKNKTLFFSSNFQPQSLGNGLTDLLKNHCAKSLHCGLFAQEISSYSDKWFSSYCGWKMGEKKKCLIFFYTPCSLYHLAQRTMYVSLFFTKTKVAQNH